MLGRSVLFLIFSSLVVAHRSSYMVRSRSFKARVEKLEERRVLAASIVEFNDVGYFFDSSSPVVASHDEQAVVRSDDSVRWGSSVYDFR